MGITLLTNGEGGVGVRTAIDTVVNKGSVLDAVEAGVRVVEIDPKAISVGFGGLPNILGQMECDASMMCGLSQRTGAGCAEKLDPRHLGLERLMSWV